MKTQVKLAAGILLSLGVAVGPALTAQAQTTGTDKAKLEPTDQTDAKVAPAPGLSAVAEALKQVIEAAEEERSIQRGVRAALVNALRAVGFSEAAILAKLESIAGALKHRFGIEVVDFLE